MIYREFDMLKKIFIITIFFALCAEHESPIKYLFVHGVGGSKKTARKYIKHNFLKEGHAESFNFCDILTGTLKRSECHLAQKKDIETLHNAYDQLCVSKNSFVEKKTEAKGDAQQTVAQQPYKIVFFGLSRGASTIINFMGVYKPKHIAAIILESPFGHIDDSLGHIYRFLPMCIKRVIFNYIYPQFNEHGEHPIDYIHIIDKDVPIAFICTKEDELVPWSSTIRLYQKLVAAGHKKVHLLILDKGKHAEIIENGDYQSFVHAFYQYYALPYDVVLANKGKKYFEIR